MPCSLPPLPLLPPPVLTDSRKIGTILQMGEKAKEGRGGNLCAHCISLGIYVYPFSVFGSEFYTFIPPCLANTYPDIQILPTWTRAENQGRICGGHISLDRYRTHVGYMSCAYACTMSAKYLTRDILSFSSSRLSYENKIAGFKKTGTKKTALNMK